MSVAAVSSVILVTDTVRGLVAGSSLRFTDRGAHQLAGVDGTHPLYALA